MIALQLKKRTKYSAFNIFSVKFFIFLPCFLYCLLFSFTSNDLCTSNGYFVISEKRISDTNIIKILAFEIQDRVVKRHENIFNGFFFPSSVVYDFTASSPDNRNYDYASKDSGNSKEVTVDVVEVKGDSKHNFNGALDAFVDGMMLGAFIFLLFELLEAQRLASPAANCEARRN